MNMRNRVKSMCVGGVVIGLVMLAAGTSLWSRFTPRQRELDHAPPHGVEFGALRSDALVAVDAPLTVEETIGAVFLTERSSHIHRRANPAAKIALYQMLDEDVEDMGLHQTLIRILGYIGDGRDAEKLVDRLKKYQGVLWLSRRGHRNAASEIFLSLGVMSRRGLSEASTILNEMLSPEYWQNSFKWTPDGFTGDPLPSEIQSIAWAIRGCAIAGRRDLVEIRESVLSQIADPKVRECMSWTISMDRMISLEQEIRIEEASIPTRSEREILRRLYDEREQVLPAFRKLPESERKFRALILNRKSVDEIRND